jgi:hypothetical protein
MDEKEKARRAMVYLRGRSQEEALETIEAYVAHSVLAKLYDTLIHENVIFNWNF